MTNQPGIRCEAALQYLDTHIAAEPPDPAILRHFDECAACARERAVRAQIALRLKSAVENQPENPYLAARIRRTILEHEAGRPHWHWRRNLSLAAAGLALCFVIAIAYQLGHLRLTTASQNAYIASISRKVGGILSVGLGDHVHCTVFKRRPKSGAPREQMLAELGPGYAGLLPVVSARVPKGYTLFTAHRCGYRGRKFVHLAMMGEDGGLISLVITRKREGEAFRRDELAPVLSQTGITMYQGGVQRFSIAGFETREHLVYVVSDLRPDQNVQFLASLAQPVDSVLSKLEG